MTDPNPLKEAAKEAVRANRAHDWDAFDRAMARLEALTSDDAPPPVDLGEMCKSILLSPYKRGR